MITEDKAHAARAPKEGEFDKLPKKEQIAELIFQLRDQNGQQWSQPGACDIFLDLRGEASPASRLVAMGYDCSAGSDRSRRRSAVDVQRRLSSQLLFLALRVAGGRSTPWQSSSGSPAAAFMSAPRPPVRWSRKARPAERRSPSKNGGKSSRPRVRSRC